VFHKKRMTRPLSVPPHTASGFLRGIFLVVLIALPSLQAQAPVDFDQIRNFKLPEYDEKTGDLRSIIYGKEAKIFRKAGYSDMKEMKIEVYQDNKVDTFVTSPGCRFQLEKGVATSDDTIHIERKDLEVFGRGYVWQRDQQRFEIKHKARVVLKNAKIELFNPVPEKKENEAKPNS
jgi:hypothetical protein